MGLENGDCQDNTFEHYFYSSFMREIAKNAIIYQ